MRHAPLGIMGVANGVSPAAWEGGRHHGEAEVPILRRAGISVGRGDGGPADVLVTSRRATVTKMEKQKYQGFFFVVAPKPGMGTRGQGNNRSFGINWILMAPPRFLPTKCHVFFAGRGWTTSCPGILTDGECALEVLLSRLSLAVTVTVTEM